MLYMLDTDAASYIIKGKSPDMECKLAALMTSALCTSVMTRAELQHGLKRLPSGHRLQLAARRFLKIVHILPWDAQAADRYADIRHQLVSAGQPIGEMDMMIAAHALSANAKLVTNNNRYHDRVEAPLIPENWMSEQRSAMNRYGHDLARFISLSGAIMARFHEWLHSLGDSGYFSEPVQKL